MGIQFSDPTYRTGIIEGIEDKTNTQSATSTSYPLRVKTRDVNIAEANFQIIANRAVDGGMRPADDTNHEDYPIIYLNIVPNQQDYPVTVDEDGNQINAIYKVRILEPDGVTWKTLKQINQNQIDDSYLNRTSGGTPSEYYINANGIFLVEKPNYESIGGMEIFVARTPDYFVYTDTIKVSGIPDVFHEYLILRPSYFYCLSKGLPRAKDYALVLFGPDGKSGMEKDIEKYFKDRNYDGETVITPETVCSV